jgi:hypothetical protein
MLVNEALPHSKTVWKMADITQVCSIEMVEFTPMRENPHLASSR